MGSNFYNWYLLSSSNPRETNISGNTGDKAGDARLQAFGNRGDLTYSLANGSYNVNIEGVELEVWGRCGVEKGLLQRIL